MSRTEWNFTVSSHRAVARDLARASRPHHLRMKWERQGDEFMEFIWDVCHLQRRSRAACDFKHAMGARGGAVEGTPGSSRRSSSSPTWLPFVTGPHMRCFGRGGWPRRSPTTSRRV